MKFNQLSLRFKTFAESECAGSSELYEHLSKEIAMDEVLLELSSYARDGQPVPNLFLGAVHYLLLKGASHELTQYYPSLVEKPKAPHNSFPPFKDFCSTYREQIIPILKSKLVQTNEVRRCGYLYPSFAYAHNKVNKPLALIEIGTSAGFQLLWDKYEYSYNTDEAFGNKDSDVQINSEIIGKNTPTLPKESPPVANRLGLDLHINDLSNEEDSLWLNALIWPEHHERRNLFERAARCVRENKGELHLIEGDGVELLPRIVEQIPEACTICVFHTHVANQMPVEVKQKLLNSIKRIAEERDIFHLYNNIWDKELHLDSFINGVEHNEVLARTDGHGKWFEWKL
ncbi:DUF2332 domain-containing protein [Oceanobacillus kapialis]|uniref:DUF2332 domain-containing protein n=1 Tax=Oceanobacillus kapialis TaxID=481353 RepID=A0ABW5Q4Q0_9BACI